MTSLPLSISSCGETPTEQPSENPTSETVTSEQVSVETPGFDEDMYYQEEAEDNYYHSLISEHSSTQEELDFNFEEKYHDDLTLDEAIGLALTAINDATDHDTTSNNVEIAVIKSDDGKYVKLSQEEVQKYIDEVLVEEEEEDDEEESEEVEDSEEE